MASALGGGASAVAAGNGTPSRAASTGGKESNGGFERMLQDDGARTEGKPATPPADATQARKDRKNSVTDTKTSDADAPADAPTTDTNATAEKPEPAAGDNAPVAWPPPGLAGLMLSAPSIIADTAAAPAPPTTGAAAAALPALAAPPPGLAVAGMPAAAGAGIALDADADAAEGLPADIQAALAALGAAPDDTADEAVAAPLLHGPGTVQAARLGSDLGVARAMDPTPAPILGEAGFDEAISARVGWLAEQKIGHAHIRISPDDRGAIDVRLQLDGDKVHASFSSPHVDVRHALESSLPRLRELLGEQGFQLAHADVGQQSQGDSGQPPRNGFAGSGSEGSDGDRGLVDVTLSSAQLIRQRGILDAYA